MKRALVAFGANLGNPTEAFAKADHFLRAAPGIAQLRASSLYQTAPVGGPDANLTYLNGAFALETSLAPAELFLLLQTGQQHAGAKPRAPWEPREIDLDLVWMEDIIHESPDLLIPHPRMHYRWFVLQPVTELLPDAVHPLLGWQMRQLLDLSQEPTPRLKIVGGSERQYQEIRDFLAASPFPIQPTHCHILPPDITFHGLGGRAVGTEGHSGDEQTWIWILEGDQSVQSQRPKSAQPTVDARGLTPAKVLELLGFFVSSLRQGSKYSQ